MVRDKAILIILVCVRHRQNLTRDSKVQNTPSGVLDAQLAIFRHRLGGFCLGLRVNRQFLFATDHLVPLQALLLHQIAQQLEEVRQQIVDEHVAEGQHDLPIHGLVGDQCATQQGDHGQPRGDPAPGLAQQAPLTPEYQKIFEDSVKGQEDGSQGNNVRFTCMPSGRPLAANPLHTAIDGPPVTLNGVALLMGSCQNAMGR